MTSDEPRFLRAGGARVADVAPAKEVAARAEPALVPWCAAEFAGALAPTGCELCGASRCAPLYLLVRHSSFEIDRRYRFMRTETLVRASLEPVVIAMCAPCAARAQASWRGQRAAVVAGRLVALVALCGGIVGAVLGAPTPVVPAFLISGSALFAAAAAVIVLSERALIARLRLPRFPSLRILVLSQDRADLDRVLARQRLASFEIQHEIDRKASGAAPPPTARVLDR
jgi:hypothetical protein